MINISVPFDDANTLLADLDANTLEKRAIADAASSKQLAEALSKAIIIELKNIGMTHDDNG